VCSCAKTKATEERVKYASAHDLRRGFGVRWSKLVIPTQLIELMRHEDVSTTIQFYAGRDAQSTAEVAWAATARPAAPLAPLW
jgi:integrase